MIRTLATAIRCNLALFGVMIFVSLCCIHFAYAQDWPVEYSDQDTGQGDGMLSPYYPSSGSVDDSGMLAPVDAGSGGPVSCGQAGANDETCIPTGESTTIGGYPGIDAFGGLGESEGGNTNLDGGGNINPQSGGNVNSRGGSYELKNPLKGAKTLDEFILKIIDVLLVFAVPLIVLYIMYAGYLFVTAAGEAAQISQARTALLYSVVGGVIVLGAKLIITVIQGTIDAF